MAKQTIGEFLAALRRAQGYTQQEVADKLGISNRTLSAWEQGRSYPDILLLPALAELYGVTADEIVKGERKHTAEREAESTDEAPEEFSPETQKKLYAQKLAKKQSSNLALAGSGAGAALLLLIVNAIGNSCPTAISVIVLILSMAGLAAILCLFAVFDRNTLFATGIALDAGLSEPQRNFLFLMRKRELKYVRVAGLCFLVCGIITFLLFGFRYSFRLTTLGTALLVFPLSVGIIVPVAASVLSCRNTQKNGSTLQKANLKYNRSLAKKVYGIAAVPFLVLLVSFLILLFVPIPISKERTELFRAPEEQFVKEMQTFEVGKAQSSVCGFPAGKYTLDLTNVPEYAFYYKTEDGYYVSRSETEISVFSATVEPEEDEPIFHLLATGTAMQVTGKDQTVYVFRDMFGLNESGYERTYSIQVDGEDYVFVMEDVDYVDMPVFGTYLVCFLVNIVVPTAIYLVRRKR